MVGERGAVAGERTMKLEGNFKRCNPNPMIGGFDCKFTADAKLQGVGPQQGEGEIKNVAFSSCSTFGFLWSQCQVDSAVSPLPWPMKIKGSSEIVASNVKIMWYINEKYPCEMKDFMFSGEVVLTAKETPQKLNKMTLFADSTLDQHGYSGEVSAIPAGVYGIYL